MGLHFVMEKAHQMKQRPFLFFWRKATFIYSFVSLIICFLTEMSQPRGLPIQIFVMFFRLGQAPNCSGEISKVKRLSDIICQTQRGSNRKKLCHFEHLLG